MKVGTEPLSSQSIPPCDALLDTAHTEVIISCMVSDALSVWCCMLVALQFWGLWKWPCLPSSNASKYTLTRGSLWEFRSCSSSFLTLKLWGILWDLDSYSFIALELWEPAELALCRCHWGLQLMPSRTAAQVALGPTWAMAAQPRNTALECGNQRLKALLGNKPLVPMP